MFDKLSSEKQEKVFVVNTSGITTSGNPFAWDKKVLILNG